MACALRNCVYAFLFVCFICSQSCAAWGKDSKEGKAPGSENSINAVSSASPEQFRWDEHRKLSWDDFRGAVNAATDQTAAATDCGIGFKAAAPAPGQKPEIIVYNTFYTNKSWVRQDAKIASILEHEQGHFDLCEIYTRKMRERMNNIDFNVPDLKQTLMAIYAEISSEYENRQQAYEQETTHGTNIGQQKKWREMMSRELEFSGS